MKLKSIAPLLVTLAVAAVAVIALAGGGNAKSRPHAAGGSAVSIRRTAVGETLVDHAGRTLYLFEGDKRNVSTLSAAGRAVWPPFTGSGTVTATSGALAAKLGTTTRGFKQVTYGGHPLYYYVGDHAAGPTKGQGLKEFGALWYVLSANGSANTTKSAPSSSRPTSTPAPSPSPAISYGY